MCMWIVLNAAAGIPHNTVEADGYRGYHIPGNTMVVPNMWCVDHGSHNRPDYGNAESRTTVAGK